MTNLVKVQLSDLREFTPEELVDPAIGKFSHLAVNGADVEPGLFSALAQYASAAGVELLWWFCPGYWNLMDLPSSCNITAVWPNAPRSWPNFSMAQVREAARDKMLAFSGLSDLWGVFLDYIRYPRDAVVNRPDLFSPDDITAAVELLRNALPSGVKLIVDASEGGFYPNNLNFNKDGQPWPDWLNAGIVDGVDVRHYYHPTDLASVLVNLPLFPGQQTLCMAPGGTESLDPMADAQVTEWLQIASGYGFDVVSVFDYEGCDGYWHLLPDLPPPPPPPDPVAVYRVTETFFDNGTSERVLEWLGES